MKLFKGFRNYINKERKILDAKDASIGVIFRECTMNGLWGFFVGITMGFVAQYVNEPNTKNAMWTFASFILVYSFESEVINRKSYTTKLGKRIIYPLSKCLGGFMGVTVTAVFF